MKREPRPDFERYMIALHGGEPDRVPLGDWHVDRSLKRRFLGRDMRTVEDEVDFYYQAGFDYVPLFMGLITWPYGPAQSASGARERKEATGEKSGREWACEHEGIITNWEQFEKYKWPTIDDFQFTKWEECDRLLPKGMKSVAVLGRIFTSVWLYMGAAVFFNALERNEELVAAIFDKIGNLQYQTLLRIVECSSNVGAVLSNDDCAHNTGLLIHPKYLRKYMFPWYKKFGDICRNKGWGFIFHSDGEITEIMEDIIECGFHGFHPVQPKAMDIVETKKKWGNRLCLLGNINLDSTLTMGSPEDVRAEVFERIATVGPGGGFMVASSNSITDYVPFENMKAMFDATFEFGSYPIQLRPTRVYAEAGPRARPKSESREREETVEGLDATEYVKVFLDGALGEATELVGKQVAAGLNGSDILSKGMVAGMVIIGEKFQRGEIYIPEMMIAARTMSSTLEHFKGLLIEESDARLGKVVMGTVKGDLHDIGKNLVIMMLEGQGFIVHDLGVGVSETKFVEAVREEKPDVLGLSALLTSTMTEMKVVIGALTEAGLRNEVKIIIGGAPVTSEFAIQIGADGYALDAPGAVQKCKELISQ
jgi:uroporphyrinogen decarboxylase